MTGRHKGLVARVYAVAPSAAATHCWKKMPQCLKSVPDESVKIVNKIKSKPLNVFLKLCAKKFHTEVLTRLFELQDDLEHSDELYDRMHDFQLLTKLAYLAIFSILNTLSVTLQGKTVTMSRTKLKLHTSRWNYGVAFWLQRIWQFSNSRWLSPHVLGRTWLGTELHPSSNICKTTTRSWEYISQN